MFTWHNPMLASPCHSSVNTDVLDLLGHISGLALGIKNESLALFLIFSLGGYIQLVCEVGAATPTSVLRLLPAVLRELNQAFALDIKACTLSPLHYQ